MKLDRNNDEAVREFENWVRRELYGPNDGRAQEPVKDAQPQQPAEPKDVKK